MRNQQPEIFPRPFTVLFVISKWPDKSVCFQIVVLHYGTHYSTVGGCYSYEALPSSISTSTAKTELHLPLTLSKSKNTQFNLLSLCKTKISAICSFVSTVTSQLLKCVNVSHTWTQMIPKPKQTRTDIFRSHNYLFTLYIQKGIDKFRPGLTDHFQIVRDVLKQFQ